MTVLERLKAAGYDPAVSLFPDNIGNAGSMECERIHGYSYKYTLCGE